ncbi:lymphocyte antigen 75 [Rhinatrema bivittatum]|uniref:lymphocyte antigen 75 n=1 Tax=Rhinatrema bivittatum TaxID=194408 RepID=UPI00112BC816|nr:lymphocyte antigen 75 [Rhinatrema bivittatum]
MLRGRLALRHSWLRLLSRSVLAICVLAVSSAGTGYDEFTIRHESTSLCLKAQESQIVAADCGKHTDVFLLWKWISKHRLFNLGSQQCLGLDITKPTNSLSLFPCDLQLTLWWRCYDALLYSASHYKLTLKSGTVNVGIDANDTWRKGDSQENVCQHPYHEIYTRDGNAHGKPCEFPFRYKGKLFHDCISDERVENGEWCATTFDYDSDEKWGTCLKPVNGCDGYWEQNSGLQSCYQFNFQSALSWKEAYVSCQNQGGDLLSITSAAELDYIQAREGIPDKVWIGLNQLDISGGWQWSDNMPLNFLIWSQDISSSSVLDGFSCGMLNADLGQWQQYPCESAFPYICKKQPNETKSELPDIWSYSVTQCDADWIPYNKFCYMLVNDQYSWNDASASCRDKNGDLISIHSLADVELIITKLHNETKDEMWSGFNNENTPLFFNWSDGSTIDFTYWDQNEPNIPYNSTPNCVSFSGESGRWKIKPCDEKLKYICKKKGVVHNETQSDEGCPQNENWKRHGNFCYKVDQNEVSFGPQCNLTVMSRFEQEFINRLINKVEGKYYWIGLQDVNYSGQYAWVNTGGRNESVTYTNWNNFEPAMPGGCVAMANGKYLGKWEVKDCKSFKALTIYKRSIGSAQPEALPPKRKYICPDGWSYGSDGLYCYKVFHYERLLRTRTWEGAERFCEALGAHLPSITSFAEMKELHSLLRTQISGTRWIWVGLNKRNPSSQGSWQWSDNRPVSTVVVPNDFHEDDYDLRDCAALRTNQPMWRRYWMFPFHDDRELEFYIKPFHCDAALEWVCQIPSDTKLKTPDWYLPDGDGIHGSSVIIEGEEFWFVSNKNMSYQEAALYCASNGSELASVESYTALQAIKVKLQNISAGQKWWMKSFDDSRRYSSPFRLHRFYGPHFRDCWHISLSNFYTGFSSPADCNLKLPFICEKHNVSLVEKHTGEPQPTKGGCPTDWVPFGDKCFIRIKPKYLTFAKANENCETFGGTLPSISSQIEQDFITSLLLAMPIKMWLGLQFSLMTREHKWIDNSELSYRNLNPLLHGRLRKIPHDPFDEENNKQCMVILNDPRSPFIGTWDFTSCTQQQYVGICQKFQDNTTEQVSRETETYQEYHYKIIQNNMTWYDALLECKKNNMLLVSITDQYHQAFLSVKVNSLRNPVWIGLSSQDDGIHYEWSDGKRVSFSRWSEDDDKHSAGDCVYLDTDGFWKTSDCETLQQAAICYSSGNETHTEPKAVNTSSIKCPHMVQDTPWISFKNNCYTFLISQKRWKSILPYESHHVCRKLNPDAYVLSIRNEEENNFVVEQLKPFSSLVKWVWLGVVYDNIEKYLRWHDKTFLMYSNWRFGRPNVTIDSFYAGVSLDGYWDFLNYDQAMYFQQHSIVACKIERAPKDDYSSPLPKNIPFENNTTYSIIPKKVTWNEAVRECKQKGGHLASMHDEFQQIFLEDIVKRDGFPLWLGLSSHDGNESIFEWSDGSALDYTPWEFTMTNSTGNCVSLDTKGILNRKNCRDVLDGAICYISTKTFTDGKSIQSESSSRCPQSPDGGQWIRYKDHCYGFDTRLYNFSVFTVEEANKMCQELDSFSTLLTIKDEEENTFVSKHIRDHIIITSRVWLGLSQDSVGRQLKWVDGSVLDYANWETGLSDTNGTCGVILSTNGMWQKVNCKKGQSRIVCKTPLGTNHTGVAIAFAVIIILALIAGLFVYLYKKKKAVLFSPIRYQRSLDEAESMFISDGN